MPRPLDSKGESLRQQGVLNPHPQKVADPLFLRGEFFDPRDLVQVKYEMLRRVRVEGASVTEVTQAFGFSRPVFYQAKAIFHRAGLPGLIPQRPGPRRPTSSPTSSSTSCSNTGSVTRCSGPCALGAGSRALRPGGPSSQHRTRPGAQTKKSPSDLRRSSGPGPCPGQPSLDHPLRRDAKAGHGEISSIDHTYGYALLIRRGLVAWMKAWPRPEQTPTRNLGSAPKPPRSRSPRISSSRPPPCWST